MTIAGCTFSTYMATNAITSAPTAFIQPIVSPDFFTKSQANTPSMTVTTGSYNPPAIQLYFNEMVAPFVESGQPFRSWAHVEWESVNEPLHLIEEFETIVDNAVNNLEFPLICAYELKKMPARLQTILLETHPYVLEDELVSESSIYTP